MKKNESKYKVLINHENIELRLKGGEILSHILKDIELPYLTYRRFTKDLDRVKHKEMSKRNFKHKRLLRI